MMIGKSLQRQVWRKSPCWIRSFALKNLLAFPLRSLNVLVTSECNLRCKFCNIGSSSYKARSHDTNLTLENYRKSLFSGKQHDHIGHVHLSGGEPFLRLDLIDICDLFALHCPNADISIATNGVLTERIVTFGELLQSRDYRRRLSIGISMDGLGELHDSIRGGKGIFNRVNETIREVARRFPGFLKNLSFTVIPENAHQLAIVFKEAQDKGLELYFRIAAESPVYYGDNRGSLQQWDQSKLEELDHTIKQIFSIPVRGINGFDIRMIFFKHMCRAYTIKKRNFDCFAGLCSVFIDHEGNIRPCIWLDCVLGNIAHDSLPDVLRSQRAREIRRYISRRECFCWTECETLNSWSTAEWLGMPIRDYLKVYDQA